MSSKIGKLTRIIFHRSTNPFKRTQMENIQSDEMNHFHEGEIQKVRNQTSEENLGRGENDYTADHNDRNDVFVPKLGLSQ